MKITSKGFILPLVLVIAAALAIGGGVYMQGRNKAPAEPGINGDMHANVDSNAGGDMRSTSTGPGTGAVNANVNANVGIKASTTGQRPAPGANDTVIKGNVSQKVVLTGEYTCLPARDAKGPKTMECALGFKAENGSYYALETSAIRESMSFILNLPVGTKIRISGTFIPLSKVDTVTAGRYDIKGLVEVSGASSI